MTVVGRSGFVGQAGDGGAATAALFSTLAYAAPDGAGGMWLADYANLMLRRVITAQSPRGPTMQVHHPTPSRPCAQAHDPRRRLRVSVWSPRVLLDGGRRQPGGDVRLHRPGALPAAFRLAGRHPLQHDSQPHRRDGCAACGVAPNCPFLLQLRPRPFVLRLQAVPQMSRVRCLRPAYLTSCSGSPSSAALLSPSLSGR